MNNRALKTYVFYCTNSIDESRLTKDCGSLNGITVKLIALPCSGKIDVPYLIKAFETGADGAVIVTCRLNECQHLEGNLRAKKRAQAVESLLEEIGMGKGRLAVIESKEDDSQQAINEIKNFFNSVRNLPQQQAQSVTANVKEDRTV
jgi:F420-non-reducing hydrogenase iron-sulfur subunit